MAEALTEDAPARANSHAREPEKLVIPGEEVRYLLHLALRTELGHAWRRAFVAASGYPGWLARPETWHVVAQDASLMPGAPPPGGD